MDRYDIICASIISMFVLCFLIARYMEKKEWNYGECSCGNGYWESFDMASDSSIGFNCSAPNCSKTTWQSSDRRGRGRTACPQYKQSYAEGNKGCRSCPGISRQVCKVISPITQTVVRTSLEQLPKFLAHDDDIVRKVAKLRLEELTSQGRTVS